jgi:hypothetical protein
MLKTVSSITNAIGALNYKGTWNASTNTPTLADGTGAKGDYYVVSTAGTQTFDGILLFFGAGDWIVYNGAVWQRVEGGSDGNFSNVTLNSTDAGATAGPLLDLYRNSASPAASDTIGEIEFNGQDSAGNKQQYALIHGSILSPTSTTEQGQIHFETATAGASTEKMIIGTTNLVINEIGAVFNVRIEGDTDANLFYTDATNSRVGVGTVGPTEKLDVVGGNIRIDNGNLIIGTDGKGIDFSATASGSGTMTSELLADYEEGFWTPSYDAFAGSFTTLTYTTQLGTYVRIGRTVICQFNILVGVAVTGTAATLLLIKGFPFALTGDGYATARAGGFINFYTGWTTNAPTMVNWAGFTDKLGLLYSGATNISNMPPANVTTGCELHGCVIYQI